MQDSDQVSSVISTHKSDAGAASFRRILRRLLSTWAEFRPGTLRV